MVVTRLASAITKRTAPPIPNEVETRDETPRKGHIPKNCAKTTLFTNMANNIMLIYSIIQKIIKC